MDALSGAAHQHVRDHARPRSVFDPPADEDELFNDGQIAAQAAASFYERLRAGASDMRCALRSLGTVREVFPALASALRAAKIPVGMVRGVWVVPPFVAAGIDGADIPWREARTRLAPFARNDLWPRIDAEVRGNRAVGWEQIGLQPENLVLVKHALPFHRLAAAAWRHASARNLAAAAREVWHGATRGRLVDLCAATWPYRWSWLCVWIGALCAIAIGHRATAGTVPATWHDIAMLLMANAVGVVYAARGRASADAALADASSFKEAGSAALRRGDLDAACAQYDAGAQAASRLAAMSHLNGVYRERGARARVACLNNHALVHLRRISSSRSHPRYRRDRASRLNNHALVHLRREDWGAAAAMCDRVLEIAPEISPRSRLARAKALYRRSVARANLGDVAGALGDLNLAQSLVPDDAEVIKLRRVLEARGARLAT